MNSDKCWYPQVIVPVHFITSGSLPAPILHFIQPNCLVYHNRSKNGHSRGHFPADTPLLALVSMPVARPRTLKGILVKCCVVENPLLHFPSARYTIMEITIMEITVYTIMEITGEMVVPYMPTSQEQRYRWNGHIFYSTGVLIALQRNLFGKSYMCILRSYDRGIIDSFPHQWISMLNRPVPVTLRSAIHALWKATGALEI